MPDELLMTGDAARICGVVPEHNPTMNREGKLLGVRIGAVGP